MNKLVAILALGVCFSNVYAKGPKKDKAEDEGFVFTTVKENPITSIKNQNQFKHIAGRSQHWDSSKQNCCVLGKGRIRPRLKCSLYTKQWKTVL